MPWIGVHWTADKLNADPLTVEGNRLGAGERRYISVPDSTGTNPNLLEVVAPGGVRFDLLPDDDTFPGAGATVIEVRLQVGGVDDDPSDTAFIDQGDIIIGTPLTVALPGTFALLITTAQGAGQTGRLMATGLASQ